MEAKQFPGRGKSMEMLVRNHDKNRFAKPPPSFAKKPEKPKMGVNVVKVNLTDQYKINEYKDGSSKVILNQQQKKPKNTLMPGVGKAIGSLGSSSVQRHNIQVLNPANVHINNNQPKFKSKQQVPQIKQVEELKWRCKVCKFANPTYITDEAGQIVEPKEMVEKCKRCRDPKQVMIEDNVGTAGLRMKPAKPTLQAQRRDRGFVSKNDARGIGSANKISTPRSNSRKAALNNKKPPPGGFGAKIMTIDLMQKNSTTDASKGMAEQRRKIPGTEEEILKKIAHADAVNKGIVKQPIGTMNRIQDREYVKSLRNPGKFNAQTYAKEYGKRLDKDEKL